MVTSLDVPLSSEVSDWLAAIQLCTYLPTDDLEGSRTLNSAVKHLRAGMDTYLRGGPQPPADQAARILVHTVATQLGDAATALEVAAHALREAGKGHLASQIHLAHLRAKDAAAALW